MNPNPKTPAPVELTAEDKIRGITLEQKLARLAGENPGTPATPPETLAPPLEPTEIIHNIAPERHPHHTQVDNNPMKVMVFVNATAHSVPPGPLPVADFKRMTRTTGYVVSMNGRILNNDGEELTLTGGEVFTHPYS